MVQQLPDPYARIRELEQELRDMRENCSQSLEIGNETILGLIKENSYLQEQLKGRDDV